MLEFFTEQLAKGWGTFLETLQGFAIPIVLLIGIIAAATIAIRFVPKDDQPVLIKKLQEKSGLIGRSFLILGTLAILATVYRLGIDSVSHYRAYQNKERFDSKEVVSGSSVNQNLPAVRVKYNVKRRRTETFYAQQVQSYKSESGVDWKRMLNDNGRKPQEIKSVVQQGSNMTQVIYENEEQMEEPVDMASIDVNANLSPVQDANPLANAYALAYKGSFSWKNPKSEPVEASLNFPLPNHGGTITSVKASVDGKPVNVTAENGILRLTSPLAADKAVNVIVEYETKGRGVFRHYLFEDQRIIPNFKMTMKSTGHVRFERGSLTPKEEGGGTYTWGLANTVTQQHISVAIPYARTTNEIWWKLCLITPIALCLFGIVASGLDRVANIGRVLASIGVCFAAYSVPLAFPMMEVSPYLLCAIALAVSLTGGYMTLGKKGLIAAGLSGAVLLSSMAGAYTTLTLVLLLAVISVGAVKNVNGQKPQAT